MFNFDYRFEQFPIPHIIIRDFIKDKELLHYLRHNTQLKEELERQNLGDLQRISIYPETRKGKWTTHVDHNPDFTPEFNSKVKNVLTELRNSKELHAIVSENFRIWFENTYGPFNESLTNSETTYGAYDGTSVAKNLIGWHLDKGDKLCAGFLYLREEGDTSNDGHLYITDGPDTHIKEVRYEDNVFVIWPNLPDAWHKAGVRYPTKHLRRLINVVYKSDNGTVYHDYRVGRSEDIVDKNELYPHKQFGFKHVNRLK